MFVYIWNDFATIAMSSFTLILHVPDRFYGFCWLRILHISHPQIKAALWIVAAPKNWKLHIAFTHYLTAHYKCIEKTKVMVIDCYWSRKTTWTVRPVLRLRSKFSASSNRQMKLYAVCWLFGFLTETSAQNVDLRTSVVVICCRRESSTWFESCMQVVLYCSET